VANGTSDEKVARADRIAEQSRLAQAKAKQEQQATANALANMRRLAEPGTEPYREEMDSVSEVAAGPFKMKGAKDRTVVQLALMALIAFLGWLVSAVWKR
jgi:hypothetical protein